VGDKCRAKSSKDGKYYTATIGAFDGVYAHVTFNVYGLTGLGSDIVHVSTLIASSSSTPEKQHTGLIFYALDETTPGETSDCKRHAQKIF
jgi:hypothetical protein